MSPPQNLFQRDYCISAIKNGDIGCHTCFVEISTFLKSRNSETLDFSFQKVHSHVTNDGKAEGVSQAEHGGIRWTDLDISSCTYEYRKGVLK